MVISPWLLERLVCSRSKLPLKLDGSRLLSAIGRDCPVAGNVPVMLLEEAEQTIGVMEGSIRRASGLMVDHRAPDLYLESLGITEQEKLELVKVQSGRTECDIDPVVSFLLAATNGIAYKKATGKLKYYPFPSISLPPGNGARLLDMRIATKMRLPVEYVVGDGRFLPFADNSFDVVFSYSVIQHLSVENARTVLSEISRVLKPGGKCLVQMPNRSGIRCFYHQLRRGFRQVKDFEVRYWGLNDLKKTFTSVVGDSRVLIDCFFGLGLQRSDINLMPPIAKIAVNASEFLKKLSKVLPGLVSIANGVYIESIKKGV